jgi:hypothetical protein
MRGVPSGTFTKQKKLGGNNKNVCDKEKEIVVGTFFARYRVASVSISLFSRKIIKVLHFRTTMQDFFVFDHQR